MCGSRPFSVSNMLPPTHQVFCSQTVQCSKHWTKTVTKLSTSSTRVFGVILQCGFLEHCGPGGVSASLLESLRTQWAPPGARGGHAHLNIASAMCSDSLASLDLRPLVMKGIECSRSTVTLKRSRWCQRITIEPLRRHSAPPGLGLYSPALPHGPRDGARNEGPLPCHLFAQTARAASACATIWNGCGGRHAIRAGTRT